MRVQAITFNTVNTHNQIQTKNMNLKTSCANSRSQINNLSALPVYRIPFTSIQNASKLKILFKYNLPCIYSGIPMIDPKTAARMLKSGIFNEPSKESMKAILKFNNCYSGIEQKIVTILSARSKVHPDFNIKQLIAEIIPVYKRDLKKKQSGIFYNIALNFNDLPAHYQKDFSELMKETNKRLDDKPVMIPFSSYEFKYKLAKIRNNIVNENDLKAKKVMNKLLKESKKLSNSTNDSTIEHQRQVMGFLDWILKKSVLKNNEELKNLILTSKARLANQEVVIPFSRKSFIYDLHRIIDDLPDNTVKNKILNEAYKLPTSSKDFSAYMVKISNESSEKVASRIIWPYLASVEHIVPRSVGGADVMSNFAGATTRENSLRKSIDFTEQLKLRPKTPIYCQMYVDKLIELYKDGVFEKNKINPKYIEEFKDTIFKVSKGQVNLDISKYYDAINIT